MKQSILLIITGIVLAVLGYYSSFTSFGDHERAFVTAAFAACLPITFGLLELDKVLALRAAQSPTKCPLPTDHIDYWYTDATGWKHYPNQAWLRITYLDGKTIEHIPVYKDAIDETKHDWLKVHGYIEQEVLTQLAHTEAHCGWNAYFGDVWVTTSEL